MLGLCVYKNRNMIVHYLNVALDTLKQGKWFIPGIEDWDDKLEVDEENNNETEHNEDGTSNLVQVKPCEISLTSVQTHSDLLQLLVRKTKTFPTMKFEGDTEDRMKIIKVSLNDDDKIKIVKSLETLLDAMGNQRSDGRTYGIINNDRIHNINNAIEISVKYGNVPENLRNKRTGFLIYKCNAQTVLHIEMDNSSKNIGCLMTESNLEQEHELAIIFNNLQFNEEIEQVTQSQDGAVEENTNDYIGNADSNKTDVIVTNSALAQGDIVEKETNVTEYLEYNDGEPDTENDHDRAFRDLGSISEMRNDISREARNDISRDGGDDISRDAGNDISRDPGNVRTDPVEREYAPLDECPGLHRIKTFAEIFDRKAKESLSTRHHGPDGSPLGFLQRFPASCQK
ncbi:hypothetical protein WDU94_001428 [Cyamophila willieti]